MIDPNLPIELDNGYPVVVSCVDGNSICVNPTGPITNNDDLNRTYAGGGWWYSLKTGKFGGGDGRFFKLRNVDDEADWHEDLV